MTGKVLKGRYTIGELIDSGGMGLIYRGHDGLAQTDVAIKVLKPEYAQNEEFVARFKKEVEAASALKHRNIVRVLDSGCEEGLYYMVQEFVEGSTLKSVIQKDGPMAEGKAVALMIDICSAIEYAHGKGLVHRDIKPQNILITRKGKVKVTDFGIAKDITSSTLTNMDSAVMGSVHYFSPEQAKGEKVDIRSDIYSLGIVFFEMVTGELPFTGDTSIAVAIKHISGAVQPPMERVRGLSRSVNNIILKAACRDKEERYQTAGELVGDLYRAMINPKGHFVKIRKDRASKRASLSKRNILFLTLMTVLVLAILGTVLLMAFNIFAGENKATVVVPKLAGLTEVDALNESAKIGLKIEKQYEFNNKVQETFVISQDPKEGTKIPGDAIVTIVISQGKKPLETPSLIDETVDTAREILKDLGLELGEVAYEPSDRPEGYIIAQHPEPGGVIEPGGTVSVVLSRAVEVRDVTMPGLMGGKLEDGAAILKDEGFTRFIVYEEKSDEDEGTVVGQQPVEGVALRTDETVTVIVSAYKKKEYSAELTVTADIPQDDTLLLAVLEEDIRGIIAQFKIYEAKRDAGLTEIAQTVKSRTKGKLHVVIYAGNAEIERKVLQFK